MLNFSRNEAMPTITTYPSKNPNPDTESFMISSFLSECLDPSSSDLESQCCPFGFVVNSRLIARGHVDHFHVPFPRGHQLEARDAFSVTPGVERMQFPGCRLPPAD